MACGPKEAPLRSWCSLRRPRGVVLHAVSTYDAERRTFGRWGCATWENCCGWMDNSLSLSRDCVGGGQHAADTAAAREPVTNKIHVVGASSAAEGKPLSARGTRSGAPRGVVLHAVSTCSAARREFSHGGCGMGMIGAAYGNSLSLSRDCTRSTQSPLPRAARRRRSRGREGAGY